MGARVRFRVRARVGAGVRVRVRARARVRPHRVAPGGEAGPAARVARQESLVQAGQLRGIPG